jgi:hypothetical protein
MWRLLFLPMKIAPWYLRHTARAPASVKAFSLRNISAAIVTANLSCSAQLLAALCCLGVAEGGSRATHVSVAAIK